MSHYHKDNSKNISGRNHGRKSSIKYFVIFYSIAFFSVIDANDTHQRYLLHSRCTEGLQNNSMMAFFSQVVNYWDHVVKENRGKWIFLISN